MFINTSLQRIAYTLIIVVGVVYITMIGSNIILPLVFATIFATFLYPINKAIVKYLKYDWLSITISFLCVLVPISLIGYLFLSQLQDIMKDLPNIGSNLKSGSREVVEWVKQLIPFIEIHPEKLLKDNIENNIDGPLNIVSKSLLSSSSLVLATFLTLIYTFFILLYRKSIRAFILFQFRKQIRGNIKTTLTRIKETVQSYIVGLFIVVFVLSVVNSVGLWIIGIDYPFFWGTLAGFLAIIPYIGTGLGGLLPFLYSLATYEEGWQPVAIVIFYTIIQTIEGNLLTPKIVGDKVNINPLFAILSLMIFGALYGVAGVILALPLISIIRIVFTQFETTRPLAVLMSSNVKYKVSKFKELA